MPDSPKIWPLLTGTIRYEKCLSTRNRGHGSFIDAPILAYLIETTNGRILYDAGCDYRKVADPSSRGRYFDSMLPTVEAPLMPDSWRIPGYLAKLGLMPSDIDIVFIGHLHFDHVGGLIDLPGCEVHIQQEELAAARTGLDGSVFADELVNSDGWFAQSGEYSVAPGIRAITSPGHTAGHMSLFVELKKRRPVILCGDA